VFQLNAQNRTVLDGLWWNQIQEPEKLGFVSGYLDCYIYDARRSGSISAPLKSYVEVVNQAYVADSKTRTKLVSNVLLQWITAPQNPHVPQSSASSKHSYFKGNYWRQIDDLQRIGFVEGYAACGQQLLHSLPSALQDARQCANSISRWYGIDPNDPSEISLDRMTTTVAEAMKNCAAISQSGKASPN
jgi:hypothetical protein